MRHKMFDLSARGCDLRNLPKLLGVSANVLGAWSASHSRPGYLDDISGNNRHLAAGGTTPTIVNSSILGQDGNPIQAHNLGGTGRFALGHDPWMNVFDGDFSISVLLKSPASAPGADIVFFSHGEASQVGLYVRMTVTGAYSAVASKAGVSVLISGASTYADGLYHVVHVVRNGSFATLFVDGVPGAPVDVSTCGIDGSRILYIGCYNTPAYYYTEPIAYTLLLNTALSHRLITRAQHLIQGSCAGRSAGHFAVPTFQRASTSYCERPSGLVQVPAGWPVQGPDGGQLIQGSTTQLVRYNRDFSNEACWAPTTGHLVPTLVAGIGPDLGGAWRVAELTDGGDTSHQIYQTLSTTAGSVSTIYAIMKYIPGGRTYFQIRMLNSIGSVYFNLENGTVYSSAGVVTRSTVKQRGDGWMQLEVSFTASSTSEAVYYRPSASGADSGTYTGDGRNNFYLWGIQGEAGAFGTVFIPRLTDTSAYRYADVETWIPWSVNKNLLASLSATHQAQVKLHFKCDESLTGATVVPTTGSYTVTKNGRPQNGYTEAERENFVMNGSTDFLHVDSADFNPIANFSVITAYNPTTVSGTKAITSKWSASADQRGWTLEASGTSVVFSRSTLGTSGDVLSATRTSCLEVGKPVLITATYDSAVGLSVHVDAIAVATQAATGRTFQTTNYFRVGAEGNGNYLDGRLLQLIILDHGVGGAVVSAAEHAALYQAWKQDGFLPLTMSATTPKTKLIMEFEAKAQWSGASTIGAQRVLLSVDGNTGVSDSNTNGFKIYGYTDGKITASFCADGENTERYMQSGVGTNYDQWHRYRVTIDTANLANSTGYVDDSAMTLHSSMSGAGAKTLSLKDALVRVGQPYNGAAGTNFAFAYIRNPRIYTE